MRSSTWPILSISFRFIRWDKITEWAKCCTSVLLQDSNGCFSRWSIYAACQIHTLIKYEASYQHAILRYFIFLFRLLMAKSGKSLTVRRWHHLLMPESKGKRPWLLISRTLVWWMRTSAAAPYSSTLMVLMQEIRYVFFLPCFFSWMFSLPIFIVLQLHYVLLPCDKFFLYIILVICVYLHGC